MRAAPEPQIHLNWSARFSLQCERNMPAHLSTSYASGQFAVVEYPLSTCRDWFRRTAPFSQTQINTLLAQKRDVSCINVHSFGKNEYRTRSGHPPFHFENRENQQLSRRIPPRGIFSLLRLYDMAFGQSGTYKRVEKLAQYIYPTAPKPNKTNSTSNL